MHQQKCKFQQGFSLVQISLLVAVAGLILASTLPGGGATDGQQLSATLTRMEAIENATRRFMITNGRRPCPADATIAMNSTNFGVEASNNGRCTGSTPTINFSDAVTTSLSSSFVANATTLSVSSATGIKIGSVVSGTGITLGTRVTAISGTTITINNLTTASSSGNYTFTTIVAGMVPVTTLGLPADYALDGYGERLMYVVDNQATDKLACSVAQKTNAKGNILIYNTSGGNIIDRTFWALISYGKDGHGSYPSTGGSTRLNSSTADADQRINAFVDSNFTTSFSSTLVRKGATSTFDDIVWFSKTANGQSQCGLSTFNYLGTGGTTASGAYSGTTPTTINGTSTGSANKPVSDTTNSTDIANNATPTAFEGSNVASGDVNGDRFKDLVICYSNTNKCYVLFGNTKGIGAGGNAIDLNTTNSATAPLDGTSGFTITNDLTTSPNAYCRPAANFTGGTAFASTVAYPNKNFGKTIAVGDVNGDGYDDIVIGGTYPALVYGGPKTNAETYKRGTVDSGNITLNLPTDGQTITLNGTVWTFKNSGATGNQTNIVAGDLTATLAALAVNLNASTDTNIRLATYTSDATKLYVSYKLSGTYGTYTLPAVSSPVSARSGATLTGGGYGFSTTWKAAGGNINLSTLDGTNGQIFWGGSKGPAGPIAIGNVNGDYTASGATGKPINDIIFAVGAAGNILRTDYKPEPYSGSGWGTYYGPSSYHGAGFAIPTSLNKNIYIVFGVNGASANLALSNPLDTAPSSTTPACLDVNSGSITPSTWHSEYPVIIDMTSTTLTSGANGYNSLSVGDVNGDTYDDIITVDPAFSYAAWSLAANSGAVTIIFGRDSQFNITNSGSTATTSDGLKHVDDNTSYTSSLSSYGSERPVGWPPGGLAPTLAGKYGAGYIGIDTDLIDSFSCVGGASIYKQCASPKAIRFTSYSANYLGGSVATGDVDGDGIKDIVVTSKDSLWVIRGEKAAFSNYFTGYSTTYTNPSDTLPCSTSPCQYHIRLPYLIFSDLAAIPQAFYGYTANSTDPGYLDPASTNSNTASKVSIGDMDGDGKNDILVSFLYQSSSSTPASYKSIIHLLKAVGAKNTAQANSGSNTLSLDSVNGISLGSLVYGSKIRAGTGVFYVNRPSKQVKLYNNDVGIASSVMQANVASGNRFLFITPLALFQSASVTSSANNPNAIMTAIGDFNGDGMNDFAITSPNYNGITAGTAPYGKTYVLWGNQNIPWGPYYIKTPSTYVPFPIKLDTFY